MKHRRFFIYFTCLINLLYVLLIFKEVDAQMRIEYPKRFRFKGLVELIYSDYNSKTHSHGTNWSTFEQNYTLGLEGYVYHPRLAVFSTEITFRDMRTVTGPDWKHSGIDYNIRATFLPYRPISLDIYAVKVDYSITGADITSYDVNTNNYGVRLRTSMRNLPVMILGYEHYDSTYGLGSIKFQSDRSYIDVRGYFRPLRTSYQWRLSFADISDHNMNYKTTFFNGYTNTKMIIAETLKNYYSYSDTQYARTIRFASNLIFKPRRFSQDYWYEYYSTDYQFSEISKIIGVYNITKNYSQQSATGTWGYRFTRTLYSSLSLNYGIYKQDEQSSSFYGINTGLSYRKLIAGISVSPHYRVLLKRDEKKGEFSEHEFTLNLMTRKIRWATLYADYELTKYNEKYKYLGVDTAQYYYSAEEQIPFKERKTATTSHYIRVGMRGKLMRGASKAFWSLEAQYLKSTTHNERPKKEPTDDEWFDDYYNNYYYNWGNFPSESETEKWTEKISQYSLIGNLQYPVLKASLISLNFGYATGDTETDGVSRRMKKFFYDLRFSHPISRRLFFSAWWSEIWHKIEGIPDYKTKNLALEVSYRRGKIFLGLEFEVLREEQGDSMLERRRIIIRLRRPIG